ncbi:MAG TPA: hypothetical protein PKA10_06585 [Selenomonadales bacterium]|nr:hypothetical protein [Selenomonadales bacterium]
MAISALNSLYATNWNAGFPSGKQDGANTQSASGGSGIDSVELSSAGKSGGSTNCKKGKSTCDGCGSCQSSAISAAGLQASSSDFAAYNAAKSYESQTKWL